MEPREWRERSWSCCERRWILPNSKLPLEGESELFSGGGTESTEKRNSKGAPFTAPEQRVSVGSGPEAVARHQPVGRLPLRGGLPGSARISGQNTGTASDWVCVCRVTSTPQQSPQTHPLCLPQTRLALPGRPHGPGWSPRPDKHANDLLRSAKTVSLQAAGRPAAAPLVNTVRLDDLSRA